MSTFKDNQYTVDAQGDIGVDLSTHSTLPDRVRSVSPYIEGCVRKSPRCVVASKAGERIFGWTTYLLSMPLAISGYSRFAQHAPTLYAVFGPTCRPAL